MYELDEIVREAIAKDLVGMRTDPERAVTIDVDVWDYEATGPDKWASMSHREAAQVIVDEVLDHQLVKLALGEADELWEVLKWVVANAKEIPFVPVDHVAVIEAIHAANGWADPK